MIWFGSCYRYFFPWRKLIFILLVRGSPECPLVSPTLWSFRIASIAFYRGLCVVSTECKHPTLSRSSDDQDDHGPTVFDRLLFFNMFGNSSRSLFLGDSGRQSGRSKKEIHRGQFGPYRADWKKQQFLVKCPHKLLTERVYFPIVALISSSFLYHLTFGTGKPSARHTSLMSVPALRSSS